MSKLTNVGQWDRAIRIIVGAILVALPFVSNAAIWDGAVFAWGAPIVGLILIATGFLRFCPIYRLFGMKTCKV